jgi:hypothetical protein
MGTSMTLPEHIEAQLATRKIKDNHPKPKSQPLLLKSMNREAIYMGKISHKRDRDKQQPSRIEE